MTHTSSHIHTPTTHTHHTHTLTTHTHMLTTHTHSPHTHTHHTHTLTTPTHSPPTHAHHHIPSPHTHPHHTHTLTTLDLPKSVHTTHNSHNMNIYTPVPPHRLTPKSPQPYDSLFSWSGAPVTEPQRSQTSKPSNTITHGDPHTPHAIISDDAGGTGVGFSGSTLAKHVQDQYIHSEFPSDIYLSPSLL